MPNENIDVIRVEATAAAVATTIINGQVAFETTNERWAYKDSGGTMHYWSKTSTVDVTDIEINDNTANAWRVRENSNNYFNVDTVDSSEHVYFGNTTTNPDYTFYGSGTTTVEGAWICEDDVEIEGYLDVNGDVVVTSSGIINLKVGVLAGTPSNVTDCFIGVHNTGGPGSLAGDLVMIPRSNVNASIRLFTGNPTPIERLTISEDGNVSLSSDLILEEESYLYLSGDDTGAYVLGTDIDGYESLVFSVPWSSSFIRFAHQEGGEYVYMSMADQHIVLGTSTNLGVQGQLNIVGTGTINLGTNRIGNDTHLTSGGLSFDSGEDASFSNDLNCNGIITHQGTDRFFAVDRHSTGDWAMVANDATGRLITMESNFFWGYSVAVDDWYFKFTNESFVFYDDLAAILMDLNDTSLDINVDIELDADLTATGNIYESGTYAEIHVHDASTAQSIPTGTTYTKLTAFTDNGLSNNCTSDVANDQITLTKTGIYKVVCSISATAGTNNVTFRCAPFLNEVEQDQIHWMRKIATGADTGSMTMTGYIDVTTADWDLDVRIRHDNGGSVDFTIVYANLNVEYAGET